MTYCERCDRLFPFWSALNQHKADSSHHNICESCSEDFPTLTGLKDHYEEYHWYCRPCDRLFASEYGLHEHYRQSSRHYYCVPCKRVFQSQSNLNSHNNSSTHHPKDIACPFRGCDMKFVSRSALILHLERGACKSGIDRATINKFVRQYDRKNLITDPSRRLTGGTLSDNIKYYASARSWNGSSYECYLCHRTYDTLKALNQHLASSVHEDKIYICPGSTCRARFTTLSALCQHIESESCGLSRFRAVQDTMDRILRGMGRLTL